MVVFCVKRRFISVVTKQRNKTERYHVHFFCVQMVSVVFFRLLGYGIQQYMGAAVSKERRTLCLFLCFKCRP